MRAEEIHAWLQAHLFDEVPIAISVISPDFRIVEANQFFRRSYGPWAGRQCYEVYKGRQTRCEHCAAVATFADGKVRSREEEGTPRDGSPSYYLVQMVPITRRRGEIPYVIEMSTDVTPLKRLEQEKREAERLAAVGETVAGIAHGVKNVLMGLEGGMYALTSGLERSDGDRIAQGWAMLHENVTRISRFVKEFLDFARGRPAQVRLCDPAAPVRQVARLLADRAAQAGVRLDVRVQEGLAPAPLDEDGIYTCVGNLVSNAIDACLAGDPTRKSVVTVRCADEAGTLVYEVVDNGHGMDYEISRKVFSQFFTTKGTDRGTGLGLLTTKRIVHQHGGRITFTSEEGAGSTFRIELPRRALPKPNEQLAPTPRPDNHTFTSG
jgi:signal transduction histidine kinase